MFSSYHDDTIYCHTGQYGEWTVGDVEPWTSHKIICTWQRSQVIAKQGISTGNERFGACASTVKPLRGLFEPIGNVSFERQVNKYA